MNKTARFHILDPFRAIIIYPFGARHGPLLKHTQLAQPTCTYVYIFFTHIYVPSSGQAVVTGVVLSSPRFLPSNSIAYRVQKSHCSSIFHRVLLTNALGPSASQLVHKEKSQRIYTGMHSAGLELTELNYHGLEDNLTRHRGDRTHGQGGRPRLAGLSLSLHPPPVFSPCIRTCTWVVRAMYS